MMSKIIHERLTQVRAAFAVNNIDAYIVPRADEFLGEYVPLQNERLAWVSGFTGSAGMVVVLKQVLLSSSMGVTPFRFGNKYQQTTMNFTI